MKKIVALVLSLVMVLGLATTAFGAFSEDVYYYIKAADGTQADVVAYVPAFEEDNAGNVEYFLGTADKYVSCTKSDKGAVALWSGMQAGDSIVGYVKPAEVTYVDVAKKVAASPVVKCDTDMHAKGYVTVDALGVPTYWVDAKADGSDWYQNVLVDGKVVKVAASTYVLGGHVLKLNKTNALDAAQTTYEYKCVRCGAVYQGVTTKVAGVEYTTYYAPSVALVDAYKAAGYNTDNYINYDLYLIGASAPAADATDKVESAETFDAGIAMYVGMSVMAAAGSAVVLKKKD